MSISRDIELSRQIFVVMIAASTIATLLYVVFQDWPEDAILFVLPFCLLFSPGITASVVFFGARHDNEAGNEVPPKETRTRLILESFVIGIVLFSISFGIEKFIAESFWYNRHAGLGMIMDPPPTPPWQLYPTLAAIALSLVVGFHQVKRFKNWQQ